VSRVPVHPAARRPAGQVALEPPDDRDAVGLQALTDAVNEAAKHAMNRLMTFTLAGLYVAITIGTTTDEMLLRGSSLPLPLLGVGLPIVPFYVVVPAMYVLLHMNLLLQLSLLADKLGRLNRRIQALPDEESRGERYALIHPFPFAHLLLGTAHSRLVRALLKAVVWSLVVIVPVILLCWTQRQFLAYHSVPITWTHRLCVIGDLALIWIYWRLIFRTVRGPVDKDSRPRWTPWGALRSAGRWAAGVTATGVVAFVSVAIFAVPGESADFVSVYAPPWYVLGPWMPPPVPGELDNLLHRNLVLREMTLVAAEPPPELLAAGGEDVWRKHARGLDLRGRDLRRADFYRSRLVNADLRGAILKGAYLSFAELQGVDLEGAQLQGACLSFAHLQGVNLGGAQLQEAILRDARLQGANLRGAQLQGALLGAQLQGAYLSFAHLQGANLTGAQLQGANLTGAHLQGANLTGAQLQGALLLETAIRGVSLQKAVLRFCVLLGLDDKEQDWDAIERLIEKKLSPGEKRDDVLDRIKAARARAEDKDWKLEYPGPEATEECLYNPWSPMGNWPLHVMDVAEFLAKRAEYLAGLACEDEYVATTLAYRSRPAPVHPTWVGDAPLGGALLHARTKDCPGLKALPDDLVKELEEAVARGAASQPSTQPAPNSRPGP